MSSSKTASKITATKAVSFHHSVPSSPKQRMPLLSTNENNSQDILDQKNRQLAYLQQHITEMKRKHLEVNNGLIQKNVRLNQQLALISSDCNIMKETIEQLKLENATLKGKNEELQKLVHALVLRPQIPINESKNQEKEEVSNLLSIGSMASGEAITTNNNRAVSESNENQKSNEQDKLNQNHSISEASEPSSLIIKTRIGNEIENKESLENVNKSNKGTESIDLKHTHDETDLIASDTLNALNQQCNAIQSSEGSVEINSTIEKIQSPKKNLTNNSHCNYDKPAVRSKRSIKKQKNYSEPSIRSKLRRGDATTFGINDISEMYKCFDKKPLSSSAGKRKRKNVYCI